MNKRSIRIRIFLIVAISVSVLCTALVFHSSTNLKESDLRLASEKLQSSAGTASSFIETRMNSAMDAVRNQFQWVMESTSNSSPIKTDENSVSEIFKSVLVKNPQVFGIWLEWEKDFFANSKWKYSRLQGSKDHQRYMTYWTRNAKGELSKGSDADDAAAADQTYYEIPFKSGKEAALDPYVYPVDGVNILMTSLVIPMINKDKVVGVAGVDIDMASIQKLANEINLFDGQGYVAITTSNGTVMGWTQKPDLVNKAFDQLKPKEFEDLITQVNQNADKTGLATYKDNFIVAKKVQIGKSEQAWYSLALVPKSVVLGPTYRAMTFQIVGSLLFALAMISIMMAFVHNFSKRLMKTTENLVLLSEKNNLVSENVKKSSTLVMQGNTSNSSAVHETVASLDQISSMIQANSEKAQQSDLSVKETVQQAQTGFDDMGEVANSMTEILNVSSEMVYEFEKNAEELKSIIDMIRDIDSKTQVINEIVFQTKLLSFNASVEAARAGEYGKGFSVVAQEVGNLAQMSGRSAKEISDILAGSSGRISEIIEKSIGSIRSLTEKTQIRARTGDELAKKCQDSLSSVLRTTQELQELITQIADASKEQAAGVHNISSAMHMINSTSASNKNASEEAMNCAEDLLKNSETLFGFTQDIKLEILGSQGHSEHLPKQFTSGSDAESSTHPGAENHAWASKEAS